MRTTACAKFPKMPRALRRGQREQKPEGRNRLKRCQPWALIHSVDINLRRLHFVNADQITVLTNFTDSQLAHDCYGLVHDRFDALASRLNTDPFINLRNRAE